MILPHLHPAFLVKIFGNEGMPLLWSDDATQKGSKIFSHFTLGSNVLTRGESHLVGKGHKALELFYSAEFHLLADFFSTVNWALPWKELTPLLDGARVFSFPILEKEQPASSRAHDFQRCTALWREWQPVLLGCSLLHPTAYTLNYTSGAGQPGNPSVDLQES